MTKKILLAICVAFALATPARAVDLFGRLHRCPNGQYPVSNGTTYVCGLTSSLAADPNNCAANQAAGGITALGNAEACIAPLLLSGGVLTGEVTVDDLGLEFTPGDAITNCSTFASTGGGIFYDDSEGKFKKCQDNVLSDLDTAGGAADILATADGTGVSVSNAGLELAGAGSDKLAVMQGCAAASPYLKWDDTNSQWNCSAALDCISIDAWSPCTSVLDPNGRYTTCTVTGAGCFAIVDMPAVGQVGPTFMIDTDRFTYFRLRFNGAMTTAQSGTVTVKLRNYTDSSDTLSATFNSGTTCADRSSTTTAHGLSGVKMFGIQIGDATTTDDPFLSGLVVEACNGNF